MTAITSAAVKRFSTQLDRLLVMFTVRSSRLGFIVLYQPVFFLFVCFLFLSSSERTGLKHGTD